MRPGETPAQLIHAGRIQAPALDPLERQIALPDLQHARRSHRARLGQPLQAGGLGRVLARRGVGARLDERLRAVGECDMERLVDVAAADRPENPRPRRKAHARSSARI